MIQRKKNLATVLFATVCVLLGVTTGLAATSSYQWKNVAIGGGGYVTGIYCHPSEKDLCYIRTDVGGFYRWDAVKTQWIPLVDQFTTKQSNYYGGEALAFDPSDPNVVYIAAGKYTAQWAGPGSIFKSIDRGAHWTKLNIDLPMGGNEDKRWGGERLAVSPNNSKLVFFGSRTQGLMRSTDAGASWQRVTSLAATPRDGIGILSVLFDKQHAGTVYVNAYGDGIYQSSDNGDHWDKIFDSPANALRMVLGEQGRLYVTAEGAGASTLIPLSVLKNGSMTAGTDVPSAWGPTWGKIKLARDTQDFKVGPSSLRLWSEDPANAVGGGQTFDAPNMPFRLKGFVKSAGQFESGNVALQVFDAKWKQLAWIVLADVVQPHDWQKISRDITLPANAEKCILQANFKGSGQIWLDEFQVFGMPSSGETLTTLPQFKNGAMTEGTDMPTAWGPNWGKIKMARDMQVYKSAPASLRVWSEDAVNAVTGGQTFDAPTGPFRVSGFAKSTGNFADAVVALQVFDANWKQVNWVVLTDVQNPMDWQAFTRDITLSPNAAKCLLVVNIKGQGTVWLDDVQVQSISSEREDPAAGLKGKMPGVRSYDGAGNWKSIAPRCDATAFTSISVNPNHPNEVVIGAGGMGNTSMFLSANGGETWQPLKFAVHNNVPWQSDHFFNSNTASMEFDPCVDGRVWFTDWYGVWRMDDVHATPVAVSNFDMGLEELVIFGFAAPPSGPELLTGVADVDGFVHDAGTAKFPSTTFSNYGKIGTWFQDTYSIAYCAAQPQHIVRVCGNRWNSTYSGQISRDAGKTWQSINLNTTDTQLLRVAMSATNPQTFLITLSEKAAQVTHDGGSTWSTVSGLPNGPKGPWYWGMPLAADTVDGKTFYYYADGKAYRSNDGGNTFTQVNTSLPSEWSAQLKAAPGVHGEVWVGVGDNGLYYSTNGGTTFMKVINVERALTFALGKPRTGSVPVIYLYGAVNKLGDGIFRSVNRGVTWERISDENVAIGDEPRIMEASLQQPGVIYIGTNGRGVYLGSPR